MGVERGPRRWILLRGLGREAGHWGNFITELKAALPMADVSALDLPGAGSKYRELSPTKMKTYVDSLFKEADVKEPVGLIGLSLGAMVALEWADLEPQSVSHVVVMNSSVASLSKPWQRFSPEALLRGLRVAASRTQAAREKEILELTSNSAKAREAAYEGWVKIAEQRPVPIKNYFRQIAAAALSRPDFVRIHAHGLVLASRADRLVSYRCSEALAKALNWPLALHSSSGHDLPLDDPKWCVWQINDWLTRVKR